MRHPFFAKRGWRLKSTAVVHTPGSQITEIQTVYEHLRFVGGHEQDRVREHEQVIEELVVRALVVHRRGDVLVKCDAPRCTFRIMTSASSSSTTSGRERDGRALLVTLASVSPGSLGLNVEQSVAPSSRASSSPSEVLPEPESPYTNAAAVPFVIEGRENLVHDRALALHRHE